MGTIYNTQNDFWIKPGALNIGINHFDDPSLIEVSLLSGTVIMAYRYNVISYNAAHNYRTWPLSASRTYLEQTGKVYVYARLERGGSKAQVIYSYDKRDMLGVIVDEDGELSEPDNSHYYILLGVLSSCIDSEGNEIPRTWEEGLYTGKLATDQYIKEESKGDLDIMFKYNSVTDFIDVLKTISSATINFITVAKEFIIGGKTFKDVAVSDTSSANPSDENLTSAAYVAENHLSSKWDDETDGHITFNTGISVEDGATINGDISFNSRKIEQKDTSSDVVVDDFEPDDNHIPSTKAVKAYGDKHYLNSDTEDTAEEKIIFKKGLEVGEFNEGLSDGTGGSFRKEEDGNVHLTTDYLNVRRKARFNEVEILTTHHIGGAQMASAASCKIDFVKTDSNGVYVCYFRKTDDDGRIITNDWVIGDQAYCNTFNLTQGTDGTTGNHYYWRLVTAKGSGSGSLISDNGELFNGADYHYVILSNINGQYALNSDAPLAGDEVVLLGHQPQAGEEESDYEARQTAIYQVAADPESGKPYYRQYVGIKTFSLDGCLEQQFMPNDNRFKGKITVTGSWDGITDEKGKSLNDSLSYSASNILQNTGFYGESKSADLSETTMMNVDTEMLAPSLEFWEATNAVVVANEDEGAEITDSLSGYSCVLTEGQISQITKEPSFADESYIVSLRGKGEFVVSYGGSGSIGLITGDATRRIKVKFTAKESQQNPTFIISGTGIFCELMFERGTVASNNWTRSILDTPPEFSRLQNMQYLLGAIHDGKTTINGGLILSNILMLGNYTDGQLASVKSGVSGVYNDDNDVAFWGGSTMEGAIQLAQKFLANPYYEPTEEEQLTMAKAVITHGGVAILRDAIIRGTVYATNGIFKGSVYATNGTFTNGTFKNVVINGAYNRLVQTINDDNYLEFFEQGKVGYPEKTVYYPLLLKWGDVIYMEATNIEYMYLPTSIPFLDENGSVYYYNTFCYKTNNEGKRVEMDIDDVRSLVGRKIVIHADEHVYPFNIISRYYKNVSPDLLTESEFITPSMEKGQWYDGGETPINLPDGGCVILECILAERKFERNGDWTSAEMICWTSQEIRKAKSWQSGSTRSFYVFFNGTTINFTMQGTTTWEEYAADTDGYNSNELIIVKEDNLVYYNNEGTSFPIYAEWIDEEDNTQAKASDTIISNHIYIAN